MAEQWEALVALLTAPFVIFLLVLLIGVVAVTGWIERRR